MKNVFRFFMVGVVTLSMLLMTVGTAAASGEDDKDDDRVRVFKVDLDPVPHDDDKDGGASTTGEATVKVDGNQVTVDLQVRDAAPGLPHAQHIHGLTEEGFDGMCPGPDARDRITDDGLISTPEGLPSYGGILAALTTEGDTSPDSALAVERFPVADKHGNYTYQRTFTVSDQVADKIDDFHIVVHGIDLNNNGSYDFDAGPSPLTDELPFEATIPTACGQIDKPGEDDKDTTDGGDTSLPDDDKDGFSDVAPDAFFAIHVTRIVQAQITIGFPDSTFRPHDSVTRAQMAAFIARALGVHDPGIPDSSPFPDVPADAWFAGFVHELVVRDIAFGTLDGHFHPNQEVSRAEVAAFLARAMGLETSEAGSSFPDVADDAWYAASVTMLSEQGITDGFPDGTFRPDRSITRGEMAKLLDLAFLSR